MEIKVKELTKKFGPKTVLDSININITSGEFYFLLGPSGCGKTTLLRLIAGLEIPTGGRIYFDETDITDMPANERKISMVFQNYALWPHMTVYQNISFGLELKKMSKKEEKEKVAEIINIVRLEGYEGSYPNQLSGGQQQRVALARALVVEPRLLLLDEPLSNLDANLRNEMRLELRRIQKRTKVTAIYVTHDQKEALTMADRMAILRDGVLEQEGGPHYIYYNPLSRFVAGFIGEANFIDAEIEKREGDFLFINSALGKFKALNRNKGLEGKAVISIRPSLIRIFPRNAFDPPEHNTIEAKVQDSVFLGLTQEYHLKVRDVPIFAVEQSRKGLAGYNHGDSIFLHFPEDDIMVFNKE